MAKSALRAVAPRNLQLERMDARRARIGMEPYVRQAPTKTAGQAMADMLGGLAIPTSVMPGVGDVTGLAADAAMYANYPEERTLGNAAWTLAGLLPLVPGAAAMRAGKEAAEGAADTAQSLVKSPDTSYRGEHTTPSPDYGAPLHDLTRLMPEDVYGPIGKRLYGLNDPRIDNEVFAAIRSARNSPDALVRTYRAVPSNVSVINPGDWVTTSKEYARLHGESALRGDYKIIEQKVKAKELYTAGDPQEFGWHPQKLQNAEILGVMAAAEKARAAVPQLRLDIYGDPIKGYTLSRIEVPKELRSSGIGTDVMRQLTEAADAENARLMLTPSSDFGGTKSRLNDFYQRFGFAANKGRSKDFTTMESMIRPPQAVRASIPQGAAVTGSALRPLVPQEENLSR